VAHDKAGERIAQQCATRRNQHLPEGEELRLYKNNTDFVGHSYGCHDNYLLARSIPWERIVAGIVPFLITRQIFAGAGKLGIEGETSAGEPGVYQISQRADFFSVLASIDTMNRRPLVNTRDEPHASIDRYRRFHVIIGDANMSEWATAMKIGTTALVLRLIERGAVPALEIAQPIETHKAISRDQSHAWIMELTDGRKISAIDAQRVFLQAAKSLDDLEADEKWILEEWEAVLNDLERDLTRARDRVDWTAKMMLLEAMREEESLSWNDPWLQAIDLEYHNIDTEKGLYYELVRQGTMRRVVTETQIREAIFDPPTTTRAFFRGRSVARFNDRIEAIQWDEIGFNDDGNGYRVSLPEPSVNDARLRAMNAIAAESKDFADFMGRLRAL
jgi:proteasome accessory factor A